jgi:KDO2-lipid IV(A) lauroyltransferase
MYYLFRLATALVPRIPRRLFPAFSALFGWFAWLFAGRVRRQAMINMEHVLGPDLPTAWSGRRLQRRLVRGMFTHSVHNYLEEFSMQTISEQEVLESMAVAGEEHIREALALGRGALLFSAHFGPFSYMSQWLAARGYEMTIPVEQLRDKRMLDLMLKLRRSHGVQYLPLGESATMRALLQALRKNQLVLITADRAVVGQSVEVPFFGAPARLPAGLANLSQRTGAPLVGAFGWRTRTIPGKQIEGLILPVSLALPEEQRKQTEVLQTKIVETLERVIEAHPEQWVVFSPVWTDTVIDTQKHLDPVYGKQ